MELHEIFDAVGGNGRYQRIIIYGLLVPLFFLLPLFTINMMFMSSVPEHWCHVPGREKTNYTLQEWKEHTLPQETGPSGGLRFSQCRMYDMDIILPDVNETSFPSKDHITGDVMTSLPPGDVKTLIPAGVAKRSVPAVAAKTLLLVLNVQVPVDGNSNASHHLPIIGCRHGWEYDRTDYSHTIATDYNWVCDKGTRSVTLLSIVASGYIISCLVFGQLADRLGRRMVFFCTVIIFLIFRSLSLAVPGYFEVFVMLNVLASSAFPAMFQAVMTIVMEVSKMDMRAWITAMAFQGWVGGMCLMSLLAWLSRDWLILGIITTLPAVIFLFGWRLIPESPRWLVSQGKLKEAAKIFNQIRKVNGKDASFDFMKSLATVNVTEEKQFGVISLFMYPKLALKSILVTAAWSANMLVYSGTTMNIKNMGGNQFLNFFLLAIVELPGNFLGMWLLDRFGRRWNHVIFFLLTSLCFFVNAVTVTIANLTWLEIVMCVTAKITNSVTYLAIYCQGIEIYPTCARTTGLAASSIIANGLGTLAPYFAYLGTIHLSLPYVVLCIVSVMGGVITSFIPETLNQPLPDTLETAGSFWMTGKFWSWRIAPAMRETDLGNVDENLRLNSITSEKVKIPKESVNIE